jgi:hypothetical protein
MNAVVSRFQVLMAAVHGDDDIDLMPGLIHVEMPLTTFDAGDGVGLSYFPTIAVASDTTDVADAFVWTGAIGFINATDLVAFGHG